MLQSSSGYDCLLTAANSKQSLLQVPPPGLTVPLCSRAKCYKAISGGTELNSRFDWFQWLIKPPGRQLFLSLASLPGAECHSLRRLDVFGLFQAVLELLGDILALESAAPQPHNCPLKRSSKAENERLELVIV